MTKTKEILNDIFKGKFLVNEDAQKNWGFIIFLTGLALLMITSSHQIDKKVQKIAVLNKEKRELRSQYVATKSDLMKLKMASNISRKLEENGLFVSKTPPQKIKVSISR
jgi:Tfp pilus assembly protein PilO